VIIGAIEPVIIRDVMTAIGDVLPCDTLLRFLDARGDLVARDSLRGLPDCRRESKGPAVSVDSVKRIIRADTTGEDTVKVWLDRAIVRRAVKVLQVADSVAVVDSAGQQVGTLRFLALTATARLTAQAYDRNRKRISNPRIRWDTSDSAKVTVDGGLVTARDTGQANVYATVDAVTDTVAVLILQVPDTVDVRDSLSGGKGPITLRKIGDSRRLLSRVLDVRGQPVKGARHSWRSRDTALVTVDVTGTINGQKNGQTFVLDSVAPKKDSIAVQVGYKLSLETSGRGSITIVPGLGSCDARAVGSCTATAFVDSGRVVTLSAIPDMGADFVRWGGDAASCDTTPTCVLEMTGSKAVTASFGFQLKVRVSGQGTVASDPVGIDAPSDSTERFSSDTRVTLTARPAAGWSVVRWGGDANCGQDSTCVVEMNRAKTVTVSFGFELKVRITGQGTVTSSPPGINAPTDSTESYLEDTQVTLTPSAAPGWEFTGCTPGLELTMNAAIVVTCTFTTVWPLKVRVVGEGTVQSDPAGIDAPRDSVESYQDRTKVTLRATPAAGWSFVAWGGDAETCSRNPTCVVEMTAAKTVTASFGFELKVRVSGQGTVTSSPPGINAPSDSTENYLSGTPVTLTASAAAGWQFTGWGGACTGTGGCQVTMDAAKLVTATFTQLFELKVQVSGQGTVTSSPPGINAPTDNTENYLSGTVVTLTPSAAAGWQFTGWGGACTGTGSCQVTMDAAKLVTAAFTQVYTLTVGGTGTGNGRVTSDVAGIDCSISNGSTSGTCTASFTTGTSVQLTATADAAKGDWFSGWSGACSGTGPTCLVSMTQARSVTASFTAQSYTLLVSGSGTGNGTVTSNVGGISCRIVSESTSGTCSATLVRETGVTLTASADNGHTFTGWSGDCTGTSSSCTVSMTQARIVTASFLPRYTLSVTGSGTGSGTVTSNVGGIYCTISSGSTSGTCSASLTSGTSVTLTRSASTYSTFTGWSGACSGTGTTCQVTVDQNRSVTAAFAALAEFYVYFDTLVVNSTGEGLFGTDNGEFYWNFAVTNTPAGTIVVDDRPCSQYKSLPPGAKWPVNKNSGSFTKESSAGSSFTVSFWVKDDDTPSGSCGTFDDLGSYARTFQFGSWPAASTITSYETTLSNVNGSGKPSVTIKWRVWRVR